jgi:hypothetical protein
VLVLGVGGLLLARKDDIVRWNTERRNTQRRQWERRAGDDRRGELRRNHDERVHNHNRRRAERREADRRQETDWKSHLESVRERIEDIQQDNRNR